MGTFGIGMAYTYKQKEGYVSIMFATGAEFR